MNDLIYASRAELDALHQRWGHAHAALRMQPLGLSMARGVPSTEQVSLSEVLLSLPGAHDFLAEDGADCRNYRGLQGLPEARRLFAFMLGVPPEQVVADGNSSLAMMYDCVSHAWRAGMPDGDGPWSAVPSGTAFLCPVPGYDRHHAICEAFGIRLIPVPLHEQGPDMDAVRAHVQDRSVRGMWCIPKYSNPTGAVYSDAVVEALAAMPTAAPDFRLFWDNAYGLHHLGEEDVQIANIAERCNTHGHANRPLVFASTSKITFAGAGVALFGASPENLRWWLRHAAVRSVGPDKLNQLRHVRFLRDRAGMEALMQRHRALLAPRFDRVLDIFERELKTHGIAQWTRPRGGYFITLNVLPGSARRVVELAGQAGVTLTPAGAPFPGGIDPQDRTLRIAPSSPSIEQVGEAAEVIALCTKLAAAERLIAAQDAAKAYVARTASSEVPEPKIFRS
jgi:aspartate/methionine/tyrosine aminotransferase